MHGYRERYEEPEVLAPAERHPYAHPFGERVCSHHAHHQQRLARVHAPHFGGGNMMFLTGEQVPRQDNEGEAYERTEHRPDQTVGDTLVDQAEARREHEATRYGIRRPEPFAGELPDENERQRPEPGGDRRQERQEEDLYHPRNLHELLPYSSADI